VPCGIAGTVTIRQGGQRAFVQVGCRVQGACGIVLENGAVQFPDSGDGHFGEFETLGGRAAMFRSGSN
jgi:hypothetical protein